MNAKKRRQLRRIKEDAERPWEYDSAKGSDDKKIADQDDLISSRVFPFWALALMYLGVCVVIDLEFPGHRGLISFGAIVVAAFYFAPGETFREKVAHLAIGVGMLFIAAVVLTALGSMSTCSNSTPSNFDWVRSL